MIVIDASNMIIGRLAAYAAKKALLGETVRIINCENAYISGNKKHVLDVMNQKRRRGTHSTGPFYPRYADKIVKRTIRGMLPHTQPKGKEAFGRIKCYISVPIELEKEKAVKVPGADISKLVDVKYTDLKTLTRILGAKVE